MFRYKIKITAEIFAGCLETLRQNDIDVSMLKKTPRKSNVYGEVLRWFAMREPQRVHMAGGSSSSHPNPCTHNPWNIIFASTIERARKPSGSNNRAESDSMPLLMNTPRFI